MAERIQNTWLWLAADDLRTELRQLSEEGRDVSRIGDEFHALIEQGDHALFTPDKQAWIGGLLDEAQTLPLRTDYPYNEPSGLTRIREARPNGPRRFDALDADDARRRIRAAWVGRCAGCLLGKPVEGLRTDKLWPFLKDSGQWPIRSYLRLGINELAETYPAVTRRSHCDDVPYMPVDDDTNYTTTGYLVLQQNGPDFTPADVAQFWMDNIPLLATCTAERVAYRNFALQIQPPASASYRNPYREWIGAQIRADAFGYVALGNPELAAEFAWRDACISHVKNGIYGEMFAATLIAAAPFCKTMPELIQAGLSEIPADCRLAEAVCDAARWFEEGTSYNDAVARIHQRWDEHSGHDWCHTISNAVLVAVALLWGEEDFSLSLCRSVQPGFDTDCNGATVGSIMGMRLGEVPAQWADRLNDTLHTSLAGHNVVAISEMGDRTFELHRQMT